MLKLHEVMPCVIGLGYVGLPLAIEISKIQKVIGFDYNPERVEQLNSGCDYTNEVDKIELLSASNLEFTDQLQRLTEANFFIVAVPTPIDALNCPDMTLLRKATSMVAKHLKQDSVIVFESTVYPGATEEICVPLLEKYSGLKYNQDFFVGYSPERINPGDKQRRIGDIVKITSGSTQQAANLIDQFYNQFIHAGSFKAESIRVAEAAKVIENVQRDVNIALVNELAKLFDELQLDTKSVLDAASTKWNFLKFEPGLVGGHCIGVDPYYLTFKAKQVGFDTKVILAGRTINDGMVEFVVNKVMKLFDCKSIITSDAKILILGATFKENCPDMRNSKSLEIARKLVPKVSQVDVYDPWINKNQVRPECLNFIDALENQYDAVILTVKHDEFYGISSKTLQSLLLENHVVVDLKHVLPRAIVDWYL